MIRRRLTCSCPLLIHLGLWSATGLVAGLAFGIGSQGFKPARLFEAALAGLVGAMVGTFVYEMVGAFLFPFDHTADPFSTTPGTRLLARVCIAGFVGLGAIRVAPDSVRHHGESVWNGHVLVIPIESVKARGVGRKGHPG